MSDVNRHEHEEHDEGHEHGSDADKGHEVLPAGQPSPTPEKLVPPAPTETAVAVHVGPPPSPAVVGSKPSDGKKEEEVKGPEGEDKDHKKEEKKEDNAPKTGASEKDDLAVLPPSLQGIQRMQPKKPTEDGKKEKMTVTSSDMSTLEDVLSEEGVNKLKEAKKDVPTKVAGAEPPKKVPPVTVGFGGNLPPKKPTSTPPTGGSPRGPNPNTIVGRFAKHLGALVGKKTFKEFDTGLRAARPELSDVEGQLKTVLVGATGAVRSSVRTLIDAFYADEEALRDSIRRVSQEHGLHLSIETFAAARGFYRAMLDQIHKINTPEHVYEVLRESMTENMRFMDQRFPRFEERARAVVMAENAGEAQVFVDELVDDVTTWVLDQKLKDLPASLRDIPADVVKSELTIALRAAHEMALIVKNTTDPALALEGMMGRPLSEEQMAQVRDQKDADELYGVVEGMTYKDVKNKEQTILTMRTGMLYTFSDGTEKYVYGAGKGSLKDLVGDLKEGIVIDVRRWEDSLALKGLATMRKGVTVRARKASDPTAVVEMSGELDKHAFQSSVGVDHATFLKNPCKYLFDYQIVSGA